MSGYVEAPRRAEQVVAHHPADHPYVLHLGLTPPGHGIVTVWDVRALAAAGVRVVHLHFGYEHLTVPALERWLAGLAAGSIRLVHTVHDLDNPHLRDQDRYHHLQALLVAAADHVLTLTAAAALAIRRRFGRDAHVVPHPHVVPLRELRRFGAAAGDRRGVYVHAATVRPNFDADLLPLLSEAADDAGVGGLHVHGRDSAPIDRLRAIERAVAGSGAVLEVCPRLSDKALWSRIRRARLVALPYAWGTHSGLLEAAHDLGTPVIAPRFGGYGDQGATTFDRDDVVAAMRKAMTGPPTLGPDARCARRHQRDEIAGAHRRVYERLVAR